MTNWKTTLGGIIAVVGLACKHHPLTAQWSDFVTAIGVGILGLSARDFNKSSEQSGAKSIKSNATDPN